MCISIRRRILEAGLSEVTAQSLGYRGVAQLFESLGSICRTRSRVMPSTSPIFSRIHVAVTQPKT